MLKKSWIQIFIEAIIELNSRLLPLDLIGELQCHARYKFDPLLTRQINIDNLFAIVANIELLTSPQIVRVFLLVILADNTPNRQVINVHLIPVVVLDGIGEQIEFAFAQFNSAVVSFGVVLLECHVDTAEFELNAEQILAKCFVVVTDGGLWTGAEWQ